METSCAATTNDLVSEASTVSTLAQSSVTTDNASLRQEDVQRQKKIEKLERRLSRLSKVIRELEEKDMSLEEMEHCDLYVVESNLKRRALEVGGMIRSSFYEVISFFNTRHMLNYSN